MEKKFSSIYERVGYYYIQCRDAEGWKEKAEILLDWYKALLYGFGGAASESEWYLYNECDYDLLNCFTEAYTEEDFEQYEAAKCAISDAYLQGAAA